MIFLNKKDSLLMREENAVALLNEYDTLTDEPFPAPLYENWPGGARQFLDTLKDRIAELKAEKEKLP